MESIVNESVKQVPAMCFMVFIVVHFIRYIGKRDELLREIERDCHEVQKESNRCISRNSEAFGEIKSVMTNTTQVLQDISGR